MKKISFFAYVLLLLSSFSLFIIFSYIFEDVSSEVDKKPTSQFFLNDLNNKPKTLNDWLGKVVVLNFWGTWCPPCLKEIPDFIRLQNKYSNKGLQFVGVAVDQRQPVEEYAKNIAFNYPILMAPQKGLDISMEYGNTLSVMPYTVFIDRNGAVFHTKPGALSYEEVEEIVRDKLL